MKITKEEYAELIIIKHEMERFHVMLDDIATKRERKYLEAMENATDSAPYYFKSDIGCEDIYGILGWGYPLSANNLHEQAVELRKKKFEKNAQD